MVWVPSSDWTHLSSPRILAVPSSQGGASAAFTPRLAQNKKIYSFICAGSRSTTPLIKRGSSRRNENELRAAGDLRPATASWAFWEGCCSKLSECPAGVRPLWLSGWRGGPNACQAGRRASRLWRLWATCPGRRSPASPGTCSLNGGCHGCMSYRFEDAPKRCTLQKYYVWNTIDCLSLSKENDWRKRR